VNFGRGQIDIIQLFRVDERHFGQGKGVQTVALDRASQISPQGGHFLRPGFHQPAIRMAGSQVDGHHQPGQASGLQDYDRIDTVLENAFFQSGQSFRRGLESEPVTGLRSIIQTPRPVSSLV
jgi:hypothetical protein